MTFNIIFFTALVGGLVGSAWEFALTSKETNGFYYGGAVGLVIGLFFLYIAKGIVKRKNIQKREAVSMMGSILSVLLVVGLITALIAGLIRFFVLS